MVFIVDSLETFFFPSIVAAGRHFGVRDSTIARIIKSKGTLLGNYKVFFSDKPLGTEEITRGIIKNKPKAVQVFDTLTGQTMDFDSITQCANYFHTSRDTITRAINKQTLFRNRYKLTLK